MNPKIAIGTTLALVLTACGSATPAASTSVPISPTRQGPCAGASLDTRTGEFRTALTNLETAIGSLASSPSGDKVVAVQSALGELKTTGEDLVAAVQRSCPSTSR